MDSGHHRISVNGKLTIIMMYFYKTNHISITLLEYCDEKDYVDVLY